MLLYLHGGLPDHFLTDRYPSIGSGRELHGGLVEQRGSGLSYHPGMPPESVNTEQLALNILALTD